MGSDHGTPDRLAAEGLGQSTTCSHWSSQNLALVAAAVFAGAAIYVNVAEQPARLDARQPRAARPMEAELCARQGDAGEPRAGRDRARLWAGYLTGDWVWYLGAALALAPWPWTLFVIMPVNKVLEATPADAANAQTRALIEKWGTLHAGRTRARLRGDACLSLGDPLASDRRISDQLATHDSESDILFARRGAAGIVTLNRPKALNAVTHEMVRALAPPARRVGGRRRGDARDRDGGGRAGVLGRRRYPRALRSRPRRPAGGGARLLPRGIHAQHRDQALSASPTSR